MKNSYCKISIDSESNVIFNYILDGRGTVTRENVKDHNNLIVKILQNVLKQPLNPRELSLNVKSRIEIYNSSFSDLITKLSENIDIFHVEKKLTSNSVICTYKRSSNNKRTIDIFDSIKTRIILGISKQEIIQDFKTLLDVENIENIVENALDMIRNEKIVDKPDIKFQEIGTTITIQPWSMGYDILVNDSANYKEFKYLLFWFIKIVSSTVNKKLKQKIPSPIVSPSPSVKSSISDKSSQKSLDSLDDIDLNIDNLEQDGGYIRYKLAGAPKKSKNNNYLINALQYADKDLFANNYARDGCQSASQPVVFSKDKKEELEMKNQMYFDNMLEYGSSKENLNYYACPKLWCPQSKVPLSVDDPNAKCPLQNEKPMIMNSKEDKNGKRYLVLRVPKKGGPNENGLCVPCCAKKEPRKDLIDKCMSHLKQNSSKEQKDVVNVIENNNDNNESYIMNQSAPLPIGRYGTIPEILHNILFHGKDIPYTGCSSSLHKSHNCFVRNGIEKNKSNSCLLAIINILNFKHKKEFIDNIKSNLDFITFISLDNGNICKQFMTLHEGKNLKSKFEIFQKNKTLCNLHNYSTNSSQHLKIYDSYLKYIQYVSSDDFTIEKNPSFLYSLINNLYKVNIVIFEKEINNEVFLKCPSQTELNADFNPIVGIIIKEGNYYEPIEIRMRKSSGLKKLKLNDYPKLKEVISVCIQSDNSHSYIYNNLYGLHNWIKSAILKNHTKYMFEKIIINDDLTINKILSKKNILFEFDKIGSSYLPILIKDFQISSKNIVFYSDIINNSHNISVLKDDYQLLYEICKGKNINIDIGYIDKQTDEEYFTTIHMTSNKMIMPKTLIIHKNDDNTTLNKYIIINKRNSKKWYQLQQMVVNTLLKKLKESELKKLDILNRTDKIKFLKTFFVNMPFKNKIQIILEELPTDSFYSLKLWLSNKMIAYKYDIFSYVIKNNKNKQNEFIFSQNALIKNGVKQLPLKLLSYHPALPNYINGIEEMNITNVDIKDLKKKEDQYPDIFNGTYIKLPTKWTSQKKSKWSDMVIIKTQYTKTTIPNFVHWISKQIGQNIKYKQVIDVTRPKYFKAMTNDESMSRILQDPSFMQEWLNNVNKFYNTVQLFMKNVFNDMPVTERQERLNSILNNDNLYTNDFHILSISELLNVSILMLHRGAYGKFDKDTKFRGTMVDHVVSSSFMKAHTDMESRPLIILNKSCGSGNNYCEYNLITEKNNPKLIYMKMSDIHESISALISKHLE